MLPKDRRPNAERRTNTNKKNLLPMDQKEYQSYSQVRRVMSTDEKIFTKNVFFHSKTDVVWDDSRSDGSEHDSLRHTENIQ